MKKLLCSLIYLFSSVAFATTYYVDGNHSNASNTNPGTSETAPWKTPYAWISKVVSGDTVLVKNGNYSISTGGSWSSPALNPVNQGTATAKITFKNFPNHAPILTIGTNGCGIGSGGRSHLIIEGFEIVGTSTNQESSLACLFGSGDTNRITGVEFRKNKVHFHRGKTSHGSDNTSALRVENTSGAIVADNVLFDIYNANRTQNSTGITIYRSNDLVIENNEIFDTVLGVFHKHHPSGGSQNIRTTIKNNYFHSPLGECSRTNSTNHVVKNNICHSSSGIGLKAGVGTKMFNNTVTGIGSGTGYGFEGSAGSAETEMWNNIVYKKPTSGLTTTNAGGFCNFNLGFQTSAVCGANSMQNTDPKFISTVFDSPDDWKLQSTSPAKAKGRNGEDIGAYATGSEMIGPRISAPPSDTQAPTVPTGLTATPSSTSQINLAWTASTDNVGVVDYRVFRCQEAGCTPTVVEETVTTVNHSDMGLAENTTYGYAITARDAAGNESAKSATVMATTQSTPTSSCVGVNIQPGQSIQAAVDANPEGTTFCIQPGVHRILTSAVAPKNNNKFIGVNDAAGMKPVVTGAKVVTPVAEGLYWVITGQTQQVTPHTGLQCTSGGLDCTYPEAVFYNSVPKKQKLALTGLAVGEFYFDYAEDKIYLVDNPSGFTVEATASAPAAFIGFPSGGGEFVSVRNLLFEKFPNTNAGGAEGALKTTNGWLVEDSEFRLNQFAGFRLTGAGGVARNNYTHNNVAYGMTGSGANMSLVESNEIAFNNDGTLSDGYAGGTKFVRTDGLTLRGNYAHHNKGPGLWADGNNINFTYEGNIVEHNTGPGIFHELSHDAVIRNNIVSFNAAETVTGRSIWWGSNIHLNDGKNVEIYGNMIEAEGLSNGIGIVNIARGSGQYGVFESRNVNVHDNRITMPAGALTGFVGDQDANQNIRFENNTYFLTDLTGKYWQWPNTNELTKQEWQALGQDVNGTFTLIGCTCP